MATTLAPAPIFRSWDNNGNPLVNGQLNTYAAGTSTPQITYTDSTGNTPNTNPVVLNSRGEASVWLNPSLSYKFVLTDSLLNLIWSVDNITSPIIQTPFGNTSGTNTITVNTTPAFSSVVDGLTMFIKIANTNTGNVTINANSTGSFNAYYAGGSPLIIAGALIQNIVYEVVFNSSLNGGLGGWEVQNPSRVVGSFTITLTGFTAPVTGTVNYAIGTDGETVLISVRANINGTSNTTAMTGTGVPAVLSAVSSGHRPFAIGQDAGTVQVFFVNNVNVTTWAFSTFAGAFTASGTKGFLACDFTYGLD